MAIPLILHFADSESDRVHLDMHNKVASRLIPDHSNLAIGDWKGIPNYSMQRVVRISVNDIIIRRGRMKHPVDSLFDMFGVDGGNRSMRVKFAEMDDVPIYDWVIGTWSEDQNRNWMGSGFSDFLKRVEWSKTKVLGRPYHGHDDNLDLICNIIKRARNVLTIDNGIGRLAQAIGVNNHICLCSNVVPKEWVYYPGVKMIYGSNDSWKPDEILGLAV